MAFTRTSTYTQTFTRLSLIKLQVERVLRRGGVSRRLTATVLDGIDNKWIKTIILDGVDTDEATWVDLSMEIDWDRNRLHMAAGRSSVTIDERWEDGLAVVSELALKLFNECRDARKLDVKVRLRYVESADYDEVRRKLHFSKTTPQRWAGTPVSSGKMKLPEIDEFSIDVRGVAGDL